jgi:hypothetical protein
MSKGDDCMSNEMLCKIADLKREMLPKEMVKHLDVIEDEMAAMAIETFEMVKKKRNASFCASKETTKVRKVNIG